MSKTEKQKWNIDAVESMLLDEDLQNDCWFQIANTVEDMSDETTFDGVIELLKSQFFVVPRNRL